MALDNAQLDNGTNDHSLFSKFNIADVSPDAAVRLDYKYQDASNYTDFYVTTGGNLRYTAVVGGVTVFDVTSTAVIPAVYADGAILSGVSLTRETASAAGSAAFYIDASQLGDAVSITAAATVDISNTGNAYFMGTDSVRSECSWFETLRYNRALSSTEALSLAINGPDLADAVRASQVDIVGGLDFTSGWTDLGTVSATNTTGFTVGSGNSGKRKQYPIRSSPYITRLRIKGTLVGTSMQILNWSATEIYGTVGEGSFDRYIDFYHTQDTRGFYVRLVNSGGSVEFDFFEARNIGITAHYNAADAQSDTGQVLDSSGNGNHALLPARGANIIPQPEGLRQVKATLTWSGDSSAKYLVSNQDILPEGAEIERVTAVIEGKPIDGTLGDSADNDRYCTLEQNTGLIEGSNRLALSERTTDGTNRELLWTPSAAFTGTIKFTIHYFVGEQ
ncbi:hypothetical protein [Pseudohongiella nitratireducens]|nr:hypothetical protein [Pseudohongiella nitratireducens]